MGWLKKITKKIAPSAVLSAVTGGASDVVAAVKGKDPVENANDLKKSYDGSKAQRLVRKAGDVVQTAGKPFLQSVASGGLADMYYASKEKNFAGGLDRVLDPGGVVDTSLRSVGSNLSPDAMAATNVTLKGLGTYYLGPIGTGMAGGIMSKLQNQGDTATTQNTLKSYALGAGGAGAGVAGNAVSTGVGGTSGAILGGATSGAINGAGTALANGSNVGEGALLGGVTGGIASSVNPVTGTLVDEGVNKGVANTAANTVAGAAAGAAGSAITGNDIGTGAQLGALSGGIKSGIYNAVSPTTQEGKAATAMLGNQAYNYAKGLVAPPRPSSQPMGLSKQQQMMLSQLRPMQQKPAVTNQQQMVLQMLRG